MKVLVLNLSTLKSTSPHPWLILWMFTLCSAFCCFYLYKLAQAHPSIFYNYSRLVMRQLKLNWFKINALKLQAVSHNTTRLIIATSTLIQYIINGVGLVVIESECILTVSVILSEGVRSHICLFHCYDTVGIISISIYMYMYNTAKNLFNTKHVHCAA